MTLYNYHTLSIGLELMNYYDQVTNSCRFFCPFLKKNLLQGPRPAEEHHVNSAVKFQFIEI